MAVLVGMLLLASCTPPPTLTPQQQIAQIVSFVELARGHSFVTPPDVEFLDDAAFRADILAQLAAAEPEVQRAETTFRATGWLAPGDSLWAKYQIAFGGAVVGYYDPTTGVLKVRGTDLTPYRREVIAHELTHALDDQIIGLDDQPGDTFLSEARFASLVAIEGSAARVQQAYYANMSAIEQGQDLFEQLQLGSDPALLTVPLALLTFTQAPYLRGAVFSAQMAAIGGVPAGVDETLERFPATAEQAFDTAKYVADEPAVAVPVPPADGTVVESGTWGQYLLTLLIRNGLALDQVDPVTQGWAGDAYVTWENGTEDCLRLDTSMDTQAQADALATELVAWAQTRPDASVVALGPTAVRVTTCVA
jgi:hypothetical protein